jgi:hypothetical protein
MVLGENVAAEADVGRLRVDRRHDAEAGERVRVPVPSTSSSATGGACSTKL